MSEMALQTPLTPTAVRPKKLWTYSRMMSELPETNRPTELWDGELVMTPAPTPLQQEISQRLEGLMIAFVQANRLGRVYRRLFESKVMNKNNLTRFPNWCMLGKSTIPSDQLEGGSSYVLCYSASTGLSSVVS